MPQQRTQFSEEIRQAIRDSGMYMFEVAKAVRIAPSALSRFMSGERGLQIHTLDRLAELLDLHVVSGSGQRKGR